MGLSPRGSLIPPKHGSEANRIVGRTSPRARSPDALSDGGAINEVQLETVHPLRLRLLLEIERTGSISAAAEACAIGQPSASMHLRTLEAAIGHRLVIRNGRGSSLTAAGEVVALHAARVLATLDSMRRAVDALDARNGGALTIAASLTPSIVLIPPILRLFSDRYPGVSVKLRTVPSESVVREVARGGADIGIAGEASTADSVIRTQLLVEELVGIAPVGLLRVDGDWVSLGELARNNLLLGAHGSSTRIVTERYLARAEYRPSRVWVFDSYEAIKRAVAGGLGVSFISPLLVHGAIERGELIAFRVAGIEPMTRPIQVVQSSATELTPESAAFVKLLAEAPWSAAEQWRQVAKGPV
jgi:molybdate transport repressor ModE-like protein